MNMQEDDKAGSSDDYVTRLEAAARELMSDLFLQIEPKHGPEVASNYPSIQKMRDLLNGKEK
jgi:hypothetical protein